MKSLFLMRHSYAMSDNSAFSDKERPLTESGRLLVRQTAEILSESTVTKIICSSAVRTLQTAEIIAAALGLEIHQFDSLYLASASVCRNIALRHAEAQDDGILIVGHNPGIASLILSWSDESYAVTPCTVAQFTSDCDTWSDFLNQRPQLNQLIIEGKRRLCVREP